MSSSSPASSSPSLWCPSCQILVDNSYALGLPCPFCGVDSVMQITDSRIHAILDLLNQGQADYSSSNIYGDGDGPLHRGLSLRIEGVENPNVFFSSPRHFLEFLAFLARISREVDIENAEEEQHSSLRAARRLSPVPEDEASDDDHSYGFRQVFEGNHSNQDSDISALLGQALDTGNGGEGSERHADSDEGFLFPMLEFIIHHLGQAESGSYGTAPASKAAVAALPTLQFSKKCNDEDDMWCAICKEVFECGEEVKEMPCTHVYHSGCILPWLELNSSCPLCRSKLPGEETRGGLSEESVGVSAEAGENGLALFEISGEGIHMLSFVLIATQANETENQQGQESAPESEGSAQGAASMAAINGGEDGRLVSLESQDGKVGPVSEEHRPGLASLGNIRASIEQMVGSESASEMSGYDPIETAHRTSHSQLQRTQMSMPDVSVGHERLAGLDEVSQGAQYATFDIGESRGPQLRRFCAGDASSSRYNRLQGSGGSDDLESSSWMQSLQSFFSWVFGFLHTQNSAGEDARVRHSCW